MRSAGTAPSIRTEAGPPPRSRSRSVPAAHLKVTCTASHALQPFVYSANIVDAMRDKWTDEPLDDLNARVGEMGRRMDEGFNRLDVRIDRSTRSWAHSTGRSMPSTGC
jgi:hypothetical protein